MKNAHIIITCQLMMLWIGISFSLQATPITLTPVETYDTISVCFNDFPIQYGDSQYIIPGNYTASFKNGDSIVLLTIHALPVYQNSDNISVCTSDFPIMYGDSSIKTPGLHNIVFKSQNGCDSIINLTVFELTPYEDFDTLYVCDNEFPFMYGDSTITQEDNYKIVFKSMDGCDSIINLTVFDLISYEDFDTLYICDNGFPFMYGDSTITQEGIYEIIFKSRDGCDSLIRLKVYELPTYHHTDVLDICESQFPYLYGDSIIASTGFYPIMFRSATGCDSLIDLTVTSRPSYHSTDSKILCNKELPFTYGDSTLYEGGVYDITFTTISGCDSVITLTLIVNPDYAIYDTLSICQIDYPLTYRDSVYFTPGDYIIKYETVNGCDSIIYFALRTFTQTKPILSGDADLCISETSHILISNAQDAQYAQYIWSNGAISPSIVVSDSGTFRVITTDVNGCKDTSEYFTVVNYLPVSVSGTTSICSGDQTVFTATGGNYYQWSNGMNTASVTVGNSGKYYVTISNNPNCVAYDSISLTLLPLPDLTITDPQEICIYANPEATLPINTTLTVNDALTTSTYRWSTNATTTSITVKPETLTTYTVTATNQYQCTATAATEVRTFPEIEIAGDIDICIGEQATIRAGGGIAYEWTGNAQISTQTAIYTPTVPGISTNSVKVTDSHGCYNSETFQIAVHSLPEVSILGGSTFCTGDTVELIATGGRTYQWSNSTIGNSTKVTTTNTYRVTATNEYECSAIASKTVTFNTSPTVSINVESSEICRNQTTTLTAISDGTFLWSTGSSNQSITVGNSNTYIVTVTKNGCIATASTNIVVNPLPIVTINGNQSICEGQSTTLKATPGYASYSWTGGSSRDSLTVSTAGSYSVTVTDAKGCSNSASLNVSTKSIPTLTITGEGTICQGGKTVLQADAENVTYLWSTGSINSYIEAGATGTYTVTATGSNGCSTSKSKTVIVRDKPTVTITGTTTICNGGSTRLTANASGSTTYTYRWSDDNATTQSFINISPSSTTTYTVYVTDENGCIGQRDATVTVNAIPTPYISGNTQICSGSSAMLTASGGTSYRWNSGETTSSITVNNINAGTHTVTVTNLYTCSATASITTTINPVPVPVINGQNIICEGNTTEFTATGGSSYRWSNGVERPNIIPDTPGRYIVTVTNDYNCIATGSINFIINPKPAIGITGTTDLCYGNSGALTAVGQETLRYHWNTDETNSSINIAPTNSRDYYLTVTNNNGCTATATHSVIVHSNPLAEIVGNGAICSGDSTKLTAKGGVSYLWSNNSRDSAIIARPSGNTTYTVTVTDLNGCRSTASKTISMNPTVTLTLTGNTDFCQGGSTSLTASGATDVLWSTGQTTSTITITQGGNYGVTITNTFGCKSSQQILIEEISLPTPVITGNRTICNGENTTLYAAGGSSYLWSNGATTSSIEIAPDNATEQPRQVYYTVTVTGSNDCQVIVNDTVTVNPSPTPFIDGASTLCQGDTITLSALGGSTFQWSNGATTQNIPVYNPNTYVVTAFNDYGCSTAISHTVTSNPKPIPVIEGNTIFCSGSSTTLTATGGVAYEWSNGSISPGITVTDENIYIVTVFNQYGCAASTSVTTTHLPAPESTIFGDASICSGNELTLSVLDVYSNYLWSTGSTQPSITVSPTENTIYNVTITNSDGCSAVFQHEVSVHSSPTNAINDKICQGLPYTLNGFDLPVQEEPGEFTHYLTVPTSYGCDSVVTLTLTVEPKPVFTQEITGLASITTQGSYPYTIYNTLHATGYQWSINNPYWTITQNNTNSISLLVTSRGTATLTVVAANNCGLSEPATLLIESTVAIEEVDLKKGIDLFPNPTVDKVTVKNSQYSNLRIDIFDLHGKLINTIETTEKEFQVDLEEFAKGTYLFRFIHNNERIGTSKVIKL